eukprot:463880_1
MSDEKQAEENKENKLDEVEQNFFKEHGEIAQLHEKMKRNNQFHPEYDLTNSEHELWATALTELLLKCKFVNLSDSTTLQKSIDDLSEFEYRCFNNMKKRNDPKNDYGLLYFLSFHCALSRLSLLLLNSSSTKCHLSVIVPIWGEQNRMQSKQKHKNGEDFIRRKISQLNWLYNGINPDDMDWNLIFVDDGCPNNSGKEATKLMDGDKAFFTDKIRKKISVHFLEDGIKTIDKFKNDPNLNNVNDSKKGGAVQYGFYLALNQNVDNKQQFIMYTDADLSVNLSQSGLVLADITINDKSNQRKVVIGDRYSKGIWSCGGIMGAFATNRVSISLRSIFLGKLLPPFKNVYDTQCPCKIFERECIEKALPSLNSYKGMFDIDLLLTVYDAYVADADADEEKKDNTDLSEMIYTRGAVYLYSANLEESWAEFNQQEFTNEYGWKHYGFLQQILKIHEDNYSENKLLEKEWVEFIRNLSWKNYFQICQIVFLTGINVQDWSPTIKDLKYMINQKYPENAPIFVDYLQQNKSKEVTSND